MTTPGPADDELLARARAWRDEDPDPTTRAEVDHLLAVGDRAGLHERFAERLQFGTAGLRGPLGAGPARMNRALVRRASAGMAAWLRGTGAPGPVVVGRDARHGSAEFAADAAAVLAGAGFDAVVLPGPLPTPVLAFAVRHLGAAAGIMVTASHNPAADNGVKLYLGDGAQIVAPVDAQISAAIDRVGPLADVALAADRVRTCGPEVVDAYVAAAVGLLQPGGPRAVRVVHTSLHGVGGPVAERAFAAAGFDPLRQVEAQARPDPDFPTVAFPNPEEAGAMDLALAQAAAEQADLVVANDPDADRLALAVPTGPDGTWRVLTGDEVGVLLADHLLRAGPPAEGDLLVTTVVSSRALEALAAAAGVAFAEVLTGFKWVVRAPGPGQHLRFGYEEALGYSVGGPARDKDGIAPALVAAELVAGLLAEGRTVQDRLDELDRRLGVHVTRSRSRRVAGAGWGRRVAAAMASLRADPPSELAGRPVTAVEDLRAGTRLPPADVLVLTVPGGRAVLRPSGTEPKVKCYAEAITPPGGLHDPGALASARADGARLVEELLAGLDAALTAAGL